MSRRANVMRVAVMVGIGVCAWLLAQSVASAHCDTLDGPVVTEGKTALEKGDVTPVLKWVKKEYESEIRTAFEKTLVVRSKGLEASELADMYFFETLVRLHRAGEGAPYTGLCAAVSMPAVHAVGVSDPDLRFLVFVVSDIAHRCVPIVTANRRRAEKAVRAG